MNAVNNSEGYEIFYFNGPVINTSSLISNEDSLLGMDKVKQIEVTFGAVDTERRDEASLTFAIKYNGTNLKNIPGTGNSILYSIPTNTSNKYTWNIEVEPTIVDPYQFNLNKLFFELQNEATSSFAPGEDKSTKLKVSIVAIRIIYK